MRADAPSLFLPLRGWFNTRRLGSDKTQLTDFAADDVKVLIGQKVLVMEGGDKLTHVAKFKSFSATALITFKSMRGFGIR